MGNIHILDTEVSNKIAAGEVVERPLSIVKELVENSIDAGATAITVEITDGGISFIRVTDNGSGMSEDDAKICFLRHATSKISTGADLDAIYTLGFRGEALSSIGAVARVKLYTKQQGIDMGVLVTCEGGEILSSADSGMSTGTVLEVSDLFYNTPARKKFLKKPSAEGGYISDLMGRYVFAYPEISFKLVRDGKEVMFSSGDSNIINAVYSVYGKDYAKNMLSVDYEYNGIKITGLIGKGTLSRANRNYETFFVNKRYIKSAIMIRALEEAYKNQIMISKFPTAILNVEIPANLVDINVHPTKLECKFSNEQEIYQAVYHSVKTTLYALPNVPEIDHTPKTRAKINEPVGKQKSLEDIFREKLRESEQRKAENRAVMCEGTPTDADFVPSVAAQREAVLPKWDMPEVQPKNKEEASAEWTEDVQYASRMTIAAESDMVSPEGKTPEILNSSEWLNRAIKEYDPSKVNKTRDIGVSYEIDEFAMIDYAVEHAKRSNNLMQVKTAEASAAGGKATDAEPMEDWRTYLVKGQLEAINNAQSNNPFNEGYFKVIGQIFDTYILIEKGNNLLMIDQHAAHERLNYEALKAELAETGIIPQMILEPIEFRLSADECAVYEDNAQSFKEFGFECALADDNMSITAIPGDIGWSQGETLFMELLTQMSELKNSVISEKKERLLYTISCKAAIKANMKVSKEEMEKLASKVFALKNINTCPHGRPIVISMSKTQIEKDFKRIV